MELCRACLSSEKEIVPLDEKFIVNYNLLTNLHVEMSDGLPQFICCSCFDTVQLFIIFREKSHTSETTLREVLVSHLKCEETFTDDMCYDHGNLVSDSIKPEIVFEYKIDEPILNGYDEAFNVMDKIDKNLLTKSEDIKPKRKRGRPKGIFKKSKKNTSRCKNLSLSNTRIMEGRILQELKQKKSQEMTFRCNKLSLDTTKEEILTEKLFCGLCSKSCDEKIDLIMHLESHKESRCCKQCPEHFDSWSQQLGHRLKHIPKKQMCCHLCSKRYVSCDYLEFHYRNVHFEEEGKTLTCKICFSSYTTPKNLKKHIWATHAEKRFTCDYCSKSYHSKSRLKVHIVMHTGNRAYSCDICGFKSKFYSGLKDHQIRKHTDDKVNCRICHRVFSNQQQFDRHKCGKNETVCPICGLQFKKNNNLARHLKTHSDVQKYECTRCPAKFKTRGALSVHLDRHDGIRRRQCEYCSDKFYAASTLIKHRRIHTGEKPYVCKICNKGFTGNHNLKMHMKVHGEHNLIKKKTKDPNSNEVNSLELK